MPSIVLRSIIISLFCSLSCIAQVKVSGYITDAGSENSISNVHIISNNSHGTFSNQDGYYELVLSAGEHKLHFQHVSYQSINKNILLEDNKPLELNIELKNLSEELETIVLSAGKFEQRLEEVSVSIDIITPRQIENKISYNIEKTIAQSPGIHIIDGQANIRGGSGWSYGAGSRVLVLVDGLPVINSSTGAVQWELINAENIATIEIIKGASSVLFGSSALNGVINIKSKEVGDTPETIITTYYGQFHEALRESLNWWKSSGIKLDKYGVNFSHSQKFGNLDLSGGIHSHRSTGYMGYIDSLFSDQDTLTKINHISEYRLRAFLNAKWHSKKFKGLTYGVNSSLLRQDENDGFIYSSDSLGYTPFDTNNSTLIKSRQLSINPHITYSQADKNQKHNLIGRFLQVNFNPDGDMITNNTYALYSEYHFQKFYDHGTWTSGLVGNYLFGASDFFESDNSGVNLSLFSQYDNTNGPLRYSLGGRYEHYTVRGKYEGKPVFRSGLNYEINENNFLRASIGQGYRFPSMFELYLFKDAGEISIYSNPDLAPETGWTAELGYKKKINNALGGTIAHFDIAVFMMEFDNMVEYSYGLWGDSTKRNPLGVGFKPINVGPTRITGIETSLNGYYRLGDWKATYLASYTLMNPISLAPDEVYGSYNDRMQALADQLINSGEIPAYLEPMLQELIESESALSYNSTSSNKDSNTLKYRYRHMAKLNLEISKNKFSIGTHIHYNSFMENVDKLFESGAFNAEVLDLYTLAGANITDMGIKQSREKLKSGDLLADFRISYKFAKFCTMQILVENAFNREYQIRPGSIGAPRTVIFKVSSKF